MDAEEARRVHRMLDDCKAGRFDRALVALRTQPNWVNAMPLGRWAPLHHAAHLGNAEAALALLRLPGCDPSLPNRHGATAAQLAERRGHNAVLTLLRPWPQVSGEEVAREGRLLASTILQQQGEYQFRSFSRTTRLLLLYRGRRCCVIKHESGYTPPHMVGRRYPPGTPWQEQMRGPEEGCYCARYSEATLHGA